MSPTFAIGPGASPLQVGGCGANSLGFGDSLSNSDGSTDGSSGNFEAGSPVDIPVPIAKAIDGVDATSIRFIQSGSGQTFNQLFKSLTTKSATTTIGKITASLVQQSGCGSVTVGVVADGAFINTIAVNDNCSFDFNMTSDLIDKPMAFVVFGSTTTVDNGGEVSYPVIVTLSPAPKTIFFENKEYILKIYITNTDANTQGDPGVDMAADVSASEISISSGDIVAFSALNASGAPFVGTIDIKGGVNSSLVGSLTNPLNRLSYDPTGNLLGVDTLTQDLLYFDTTGTLLNNANTNLPADRLFKFHPSGRYVATNILAGLDVEIDFIDLEHFYTDIVSLALTNGGCTVSDVSFDWLDVTNLVAFETCAEGNYRAEGFDVSGALSGSVPDTTATFSFTSTDYMGNPVADWGVNGLFFYECDDGSGYNHLCRSDTDSPVGPPASIVSTGISGDFNITDLSFASDRSSYVAFEGDIDNSTLTDNAIGVFWLLNGVTDFQSLGIKPVSSASDANLIAYLNYDFTGEFQVSVLHLTTAADPPALAVTPATKTLPIGEAKYFKATGGIPPYIFSLTNGEGDLNVSTGYYQAPETSGTATIQVTDSRGLITEAALTIVLHGSLDAGFNSNGILVTDIGSTDDDLYGMVIQSDNKVVAVGNYKNGLNNFDLALIRTNEDGSLDSTFGTNGKVITDYLTSNEIALAVALQSDGKIVVAGYTDSGADDDFLVARYNVNGVLDTSFGGDGIVTSDFNGGSDFAYSLFIQSDGKILVGGTGDTFREEVLARYNTDGSLDTSFGTDGFVSESVSNIDRATKILVQSDGKIMTLVSTSFQGFQQGFGDPGPCTGGGNYSLVRFSSEGVLDTSFGTNGIATITYGNDLALQSDGKFVVAGYSCNGTDDDFALERYDTNGELDITFGTNGSVSTHFGFSFDQANALIIQADSKIVAGGYATNNDGDYDFALVRYRANGSLDTGFGSGGLVMTNINSNTDNIVTLKIDAEKRIVAAGTSGVWRGDIDFALARYWY